jgi:hypothetical protein
MDRLYGRLQKDRHMMEFEPPIAPGQSLSA